MCFILSLLLFHFVLCFIILFFFILFGLKANSRSNWDPFLLFWGPFVVAQNREKPMQFAPKAGQQWTQQQDPNSRGPNGLSSSREPRRLGSGPAAVFLCPFAYNKPNLHGFILSRLHTPSETSYCFFSVYTHARQSLSSCLASHPSHAHVLGNW